MSKFYKELGGFQCHTIAKEIGVHFTTVYKMIKRNDPKIKGAIKSLKNRGAKPEMLTGKSNLHGFKPELIAEKSGFCRATVYNFTNGNTNPNTTAKIQAVIEKLSKKREHELSKPKLETVSD